MLASISLGVYEKMLFIDPKAKSLGDGVYASQDDEIIIKIIEVTIPIFTALYDSDFPYISLIISVARKVEANRILPRVISIPKALTRISTSIF